MTNTQLAELFLLKLYDLAEEKGHGGFYSLNEIAAEFGVNDVLKIHNIGNYLADSGLIKHRGGMSTGYRASITGQGAVEVERGGSTGVIDDYRARPLQYLVSVDQSTHFYESVAGSNVAVHSSGWQTLTSDQPIDHLFSEMIAALLADTTISERRREESLVDVATLRAELTRDQPRRSLVETILSDLGSLASLSSLALDLGKYLPTILG